MTRERFMWYKQEIERLQKIDKQITDRVRASYEIPNKLAKSLKKYKKKLNGFQQEQKEIGLKEYNK